MPDVARKRFTNASIGRRGGTVVVSVRLPSEIVEVMDAAVGQSDLPNRAAVVQDACALWAMMEQRDNDGR